MTFSISKPDYYNPITQAPTCITQHSEQQASSKQTQADKTAPPTKNDRSDYQHTPGHTLRAAFANSNTSDSMLEKAFKWACYAIEQCQRYEGDAYLYPHLMPIGKKIEKHINKELNTLQKNGEFSAKDYLNIKQKISETINSTQTINPYHRNPLLLKRVALSHVLVPIQKQVIADNVKSINQFQGFDIDKDICRLVIDDEHLKENQNQWLFENEPGYLSGILDSFIAMLAHHKEKLSVEMFEDFHDLSVDNVYTRCCQSSNKQSQNQMKRGFRDDDTIVHFDLSPINSTRKGINEFLTRNKDTSILIDEDDDDEEIDRKFLKGDMEYCLVDNEVPTYDNYSTDTDIDMTLATGPKTRQQCIDNVTRMLNTLHSTIGQHLHHTNSVGVDESAIVKAIAQFCQELDQYHPFHDGNIRTVAFITMNKLLLEHGMNPTVLNNPNILDGYDIDLLADKITEGQKRFAAIRDQDHANTA